jgi:hypothetical protein
VSVPSQAFNKAEATIISTFLLKGSKWYSRALHDDEIVDLARRAAKPGGTKEVGEMLGRRNLPNEVLEDTFARMLVAQGRVGRTEAAGWMRRLSEVPGFRSAMSKSMGASAVKTSGHFTEIRIAGEAAQMNYTVKGIGVPFRDPYKKGMTDIDILLEKEGRVIAIEAKNYQPGTAVPLIDFRGDMQTLATYRDSYPTKNVLPVFWVTKKPADPSDWKLLQAAATRFQVKLIDGNPSEAIHRIPRLLEDSQ